MRYFYSGLILILLLLMGCTNDKPLPGGYELLNRQEKGELLVTTIRASKFATYWKKPVAGERATLLLGAKGELRSFIAFRFGLFVYSQLDTASVYSSKLRLYQRTSYNRNADSLRANVYAINTDLNWSETTAIIDTLLGRYDEKINYGPVSIAPDSGKFVELNLSPELVNKWIADDNNPGFILTFDYADFLAEFYSSDAAVDTLWPKLEVAYVNKSGQKDTLLLDAVSDVSLIQYDSIIPEYELIEDPDRLLIGNGTGYRSLIQFDVSSIPDDANVHNALLQFSVDTDASHTYGVNMTVTAIPVGDSLWIPSELDLKEFSGSATAYASSDVNFFNFGESSANSVINSYFQFWVNGTIKNFGLALQPGQEGVNPSEIRLYTGKNDSSRAPFVRITYSLPPSARFETE